MRITLLDTDMAHLGPGVRHYRTEDGQYLAVSVDAGITQRAENTINEVTAAMGLPSLRSGAYTISPIPTVILACDEIGQAATLDRLHEFPPGTTHEEALEALGFTVT